jgi:hypothetical protein
MATNGMSPRASVRSGGGGSVVASRGLCGHGACRGSSRRCYGDVWCLAGSHGRGWWGSGGALWGLVTGCRLGGGSRGVDDLCGCSGLPSTSAAADNGLDNGEMGLLGRHDPHSPKRVANYFNESIMAHPAQGVGS